MFHLEEGKFYYQTIKKSKCSVQDMTFPNTSFSKVKLHKIMRLAMRKCLEKPMEKSTDLSVHIVTTL